ncbi:(2Fe-2S)-binding protein [Nocardia aurantiaca]|nr:(2Fe-2S)-binding protein [Nocardia aurantiaca]
MVAQPPVSQVLAPGTQLLRPRWLAERIADMGISWGTGDSRVSGTLWWCMAASSLVDPIVGAIASGRPAFDPALEHLALEIRPDGGVERVWPEQRFLGGAGPLAIESRTPVTSSAPANESAGRVCADPAAPAADSEAAFGGCCATASVGHALRHTLSRVIPVVAEVSGAGAASLWAIVADAIGNRALDIGAEEAGARLARDVAGRLPVPRFQDVGGRTFVRRISCCLVFEVPGCQMCTSCPKRPASEREALLAEVAARG